MESRLLCESVEHMPAVLNISEPRNGELREVGNPESAPISTQETYFQKRTLSSSSSGRSTSNVQAFYI